MSLHDFDENHSERQHLHDDVPTAASGSDVMRPERKLLFGTVQFFEDILESLNDIYIAVISDSGKHIAAWGNNSLQEIYGFRPLELKGKELKDLFEEKTAMLLLSKLVETCDKGERVSFRFRAVLPSGHYWIQVLFTPLPESKGSGHSVVGCFQNITRLVEHEEKVRQFEENLIYNSDRENEGVLTTNSKGIIASV
ncbi:MAG: PAS domain S-box protein, partial [Bacteroidales bacterium]